MVEVVHGLSNEAYHARPEISFSGIKLFDDNRRAFQCKRDGIEPPPKAKRKPPDYQIIGSVVHDVLAYGEYRGDDASVDQIKAGMFAAERAKLNPEVAAAIQCVEKWEASYFSKDPETGLRVKCRPDGISASLRVEVKTTKEPGAKGKFNFARECATFKYAYQVAWYDFVLRLCLGTDPPPTVILAIRNQFPWDSTVFGPLPAADLHAAGVWCRRQRLAIRDCIESGDWSNVDDDGQPTEGRINPLRLPQWWNGGIGE
ncbi:MAG: hypothetical protein GTO41_19985 [Burkholderiales bacterium]|nr:hypothetical protein [Burkholderiales bacterium]